MSEKNARIKWFGDEDKANMLSERISQVQEEIETSGVISRSEEQEITEETEVQETEEQKVEEVEETEDELVVELDEESLEQVAERVAKILVGDLQDQFSGIVSRLKALEENKIVQEDTPKAQKLRFKITEEQVQEEEPEQPVQRQTYDTQAQKIAELRKNRFAKLQGDK